MDRTAIFCIALIICAILSYLAGRLDTKRRVQKEVDGLRRTLKLAEEAQESMAICLSAVKRELLEIQKHIKTIEKPG